MMNNCCRCQKDILNAKYKYNKSDGAVCKLCYEKEYRKANRQKLNKWHKKYADFNRDVINTQARARYNNPNHSRKIKDKNWRENNSDYILAKAKEEYRRKYKKDPQWTVARCVRRRFAAAIKNKSKKSSTWAYVGCSYEEFVKYIESLFKPGMTWDNYGEWELDHKIPVFKFDHTDDSQIYLAWNYTNIQPLWYEEHKLKTKEDLYGSP